MNGELNPSVVFQTAFGTLVFFGFAYLTLRAIGKFFASRSMSIGGKIDEQKKMREEHDTQLAAYFDACKTYSNLDDQAGRREPQLADFGLA